MRRWLFPAAMGVLAVLLALVSVLVANTLRYGSGQPPSSTPVTVTEADREGARLLARAIRYRTVSHADPAELERDEFEAFQRFLVDAFPRVHQSLRRQRVNGLSLLYTWPGADPELRPILLTAHYDVVPVEAGTHENWRQPPFSGRMRDGTVWGRGALDDKVGVVSILQAMEQLLADGFEPERTVVLAVGHDEEVGGERGAERMAALLRERGMRFAWMLDEGGLIAEGMVPGVSRPVALIQVAEKGYLTFEMSVRGEGGHSSMPPARTAVGVLARAITKLDRNPVPARITPPLDALFAHVADEMPALQRLAVANQWLFSGLIVDQFAAGPKTNAMVRSTLAPTVLRAGVKDNVLPSRARALVNARILPGDSVAGVMRHVRGVIDDERVVVSVVHASEPPPVSSSKGSGFGQIAGVVRDLFPDVVVAPSMLVATTDSRHYSDIVDDIYRFRPTRLDDRRVDTIHGTDERIATANVAESVAFYRAVITRGAGAP